METTYWQEMAKQVNARINCIKANNTEWENRHEDTIEEMVKELPHGSGLDGEWSFDYEKSTSNKLVLHMSYHAMNENGYYDGWIDFTVTVMGSLMFGHEMKITGNFGKYQDIRDYLYDTI